MEEEFSQAGQDCLALEDESNTFRRNAGNHCPPTQRHVAQEVVPQKHRYEFLKSCKKLVTNKRSLNSMSDYRFHAHETWKQNPQNASPPAS